MDCESLVLTPPKKTKDKFFYCRTSQGSCPPLAHLSWTI